MSNSLSLNPLSGVIWITGFSAAGKTAVGREVVAQLREGGRPCVFLDGDDLRSILGDKWGYERAERVELAKVYLRFCSHLTSQGFIVVLSAVAMYDEVAQWMRLHIPHSIQVYLKVPQDERIARDRSTKRLYDKIGDMKKLYEEPIDADLIIENYGEVNASLSAAKIVSTYSSRSWRSADMGRTNHWGQYYGGASAPVAPSPFAIAVLSEISPGAALLEIGCGNGRDAIYFHHEGLNVVGIDLSENAIENCKSKLPQTDAFFAGRLSDLPGLQKATFDAVYSRFVLHAMPLDEEIETIRGAYEALKKGGRLFIECRSINDPMARMGEVISPTERIHGHYRRFIILSDLTDRLQKAGFQINYSTESNGLAVHGDEDPVVIRLYCTKA